MRAFMSDRTHARRTVACGRVGSTLADMAEREARRILAETEPDTCQTASFGIERVAARNCAPNEWTGALAETLAAFVEGA